VTSHASGRHRAPGRFNPVTELTGIVTKSAQPAVKTTAIIAASGGLVASFALPASAATVEHVADTSAASAAPVAVRAPEAAAPQAGEAFGLIGFKATPKPAPKPKPKPKPVVRQDTQRTPDRSATRTVSRSTVRTPVTQTSSKPAAGGVLGIAASLAGTPYSYGGTSPSTGFDCSGFTQYVFSKVGISLPRTAEAQRQAATPVSNPQPGDLVFFGNPAGHVGIYAGGGMMWDSPHSGEVVSKRAIYSSNVTYGRP
jgi:peptidoglycan DL-endopeptidase CwlO